MYDSKFLTFNNLLLFICLQIVAQKVLSPVERDDILFSILSSGKLFNKYKNEHVFKLFGDYNNQSDVLFSVSIKIKILDQIFFFLNMEKH